MKKILIDTNVTLDILLRRQGYINANIIFSLAEHNKIVCYLSATTITDIFFLSKNDLGKQSAKEALKDLLQVFKPATVTDCHIYQALDLNWNDFEDSVQFAVGESLTVDYIVTRNTKDFSSSNIPVITPEQFIDIMINSEKRL